MKTINLLAILALLAGAATVRAAALPVLADAGPEPVACILHLSAAIPDATRFTDDGSTHLVWEDSLGRRSGAELRADGGVVLTLADGSVRHLPPNPRLLTEAERERMQRVLAYYRDEGVDLVARRFLPSDEVIPTMHSRDPDEGEDEDGGEGKGGSLPGVWQLWEACEKAETANRNNCSFECGEAGMQGFYKAGNCGAGSSCTCGYTADRMRTL